MHYTCNTGWDDKRGDAAHTPHVKCMQQKKANTALHGPQRMPATLHPSQPASLHHRLKLLEGRLPLRFLHGTLVTYALQEPLIPKFEHAAPTQAPERLAQLQDHQRAFTCRMRNTMQRWYRASPLSSASQALSSHVAEDRRLLLSSYSFLT